MNDIPIRGPESLPRIQPPSGTLPQQQEQSREFVGLLKGAIERVNGMQHDSMVLQDEVARGESMNIHQAVIASEKAGLSFQLMMQVRNKLLDAYQEVLRMQV